MAKTNLENSLLYSNFLKALARNNPDVEIDPDVIDRTLEYDEALNELKEIYPDLRMTGKAKSEFQQFSDYLEGDFGIDERKVQNLIVQDPVQPFTDEDLAGISRAIHGRSDHSVITDRAKKAPLTRDVRKWAAKPNRLDLGGFDRPGAQDKHLKARIDILADINSCSQKRSCGTVENIKTSYVNLGRYDKRDIDAAIQAATDAGYFD